MKRIAGMAVTLTLLLSAFAAASQGPSLEARRKQLRDLLSEQWEYNLRTSPEFASILGDKRYNDKLSDASEKAVYADLKQTRKFLARFKAIDVSGFPEEEALNKALMVRQLETGLDDARLKGW